MAKEMGCIIPKPITVTDIRNRGYKAPLCVLVDEVKYMLGEALRAYFGTPVAAATMTDSIKERSQMQEHTK